MDTPLVEKSTREDFKGDIEIDEKELIKKEFKEAVKEYKWAESAFNNAEPNFIEIAIHNLNIAQSKLDMIYKKYKICLSLT